MREIDKGHKYNLKCNGSLKEIELTFFKDKDINGAGYEGTTNQEVIRALISRIKFLNTQKPDKINENIIYHLRKALGLHEIRHIERVIEEGFPIEDVESVGKNDHFVPNKHLWEEYVK